MFANDHREHLGHGVSHSVDANVSIELVSACRNFPHTWTRAHRECQLGADAIFSACQESCTGEWVATLEQTRFSAYLQACTRRVPDWSIIQGRCPGRGWSDIPVEGNTGLPEQWLCRVRGEPAEEMAYISVRRLNRSLSGGK